MLPVQPIHPFPARMAPEIALKELQALPAGSRVLDPMMGSGTVLKVAMDYGLCALGRDVDPLAVLLARVWTTPIDTERLNDYAAQLTQDAGKLCGEGPSLPWIDDDAETAAFIDYWFAEPQKTDLRKLSYLLQFVDGSHGDALRVALSKIIITKKRGASLAWDVSHSRPHRAMQENPFSVMSGFVQAVSRLSRLLPSATDSSPPREADIGLEDARHLASIASSTIDAVVTSPPYLNAIDYLRGHRLALVWLGYRIGELRAIRSASIGAERAPEGGMESLLADEVIAQMGWNEYLPLAEQRMVRRYVLDMAALFSEVSRVLCAGGKAIFVIGNSCLRGTFIRNARVLTLLAERSGFRLLREEERELPPNRRYLPPPASHQQSDLKKRMRTESVLTFLRN